MAKIFISYRREDSQYPADMLFKALQPHVDDPDADIFIDVDSIPLGENFVKYLDQKVGECEILLALIGRGWLKSRNDMGELRLDNPEDFVRVEIASALKRGIPVVPILLDGAPIPLAADLPDDLKELAMRNGEEIRRASFESDTQRLIRKLGLAREDRASETGVSGPDEGFSDTPDGKSGTAVADVKQTERPHWVASLMHRRTSLVAGLGIVVIALGVFLNDPLGWRAGPQLPSQPLVDVRDEAVEGNADDRIYEPEKPDPVENRDPMLITPEELIDGADGATIEISSIEDLADAADVSTFLAANFRQEDLQSEFVVQIGATRSIDGAEAKIVDLLKEHSSLVFGKSYQIQQADLGAKGIFYRIRIGEFESRDAAASFCGSLANAGGSCVVVGN